MAEQNNNKPPETVLAALGTAAEKVLEHTGGTSVDYTKFLEQNYKIEFANIVQGTKVNFKAFITSFSDNYECRWDETQGVGRMDPIKTYQGTGRKISMDWDVVARSYDEARSNLAKCEKLIRMMYPTFREVGGATRAVQSPPYFRFKFANLAASSYAGAGQSASSSGLLATCAGIEYAPDFDAGVYHGPGDKLYPKLVSLSVEMTILHDHLLGFTVHGVDQFEGFPYGSPSKKPEDLSLNPDVNADGVVDILDVQAVNLANQTGLTVDEVAAMQNAEAEAAAEESSTETGGAPATVPSGGAAAANEGQGVNTVLEPAAPVGTGTVLLPPA